MQRLFGTFPNRGAGLALVILRVAGAATLLAPLVSGDRLCPGVGVEALFTLSSIAAVLATTNGSSSTTSTRHGRPVRGGNVGSIRGADFSS